MAYNQFCPIAKAMDVLGEKWTLLIVREILCAPFALEFQYSGYLWGLLHFLDPSVIPPIGSKRGGCPIAPRAARPDPTTIERM